MGIAKKDSGEESSGLYDLKELATSAKKRRTQRLSSEMEAQQSLLQSSAALEAVALPDPKKSQEIAIPAIGLDIASGANTTKIKAAATSATAVQVPAERSSSRGWLFAGIAIIAVAGAAAAFVLKGNAETPGAATPLAATAAESEIPTPVLALPALVDDQEVDEQEEEPQVAELDQVEEPVVEALDAVDDPVATDKDEPSAKDKAAARREENKASTEAEPSASSDKDKGQSKQKASESEDKVKSAKVEAKADAKTTDKLDGSASVDDILSSVTGGVEKHDAVVEDNGPSKKQLERGDIAKAMKKISPQAKACYSQEEFSGVVTVKYSVSPDGSVTGARATGAHASSKTGACVVSAVNAATFPAFSGAATSFSFPFLLSP